MHIPTINRQAARQLLGSEFSLFAERWRDEACSEAGEPHLPLWIAGEPLGHLYGQLVHEVLRSLKSLGLPHRLNEKQVELLVEPERLGLALESLASDLKERGLIPGWRDEAHMLYDSQGLPLCSAERGLFKILGLCSQALHVHAETGEGLIWLGIRDQSKHENPGLFDNLAAGGIGAGEPILDCALRELAEEAGLTNVDLIDPGHCSAPRSFTDLRSCLDDTEAMLKQPSFQIRVSRPVNYGWHQELIYLFYLRLPSWWRPCNRDGEVGGFALTHRQSCTKLINDWRMTPDAALVTALALSGSHLNDREPVC